MKLLYFLPALLYCGLVGTIGFDVGFGGFQPGAWVYVVLLILAAFLLGKKKWWGAVPGMLVGGIVIYLFETSRVHQHANVTPLGAGIIAYFAAMGFICHKLNKLR